MCWGLLPRHELNAHHDRFLHGARTYPTRTSTVLSAVSVSLCAFPPRRQPASPVLRVTALRAGKKGKATRSPQEGFVSSFHIPPKSQTQSMYVPDTRKNQVSVPNVLQTLFKKVVLFHKKLPLQCNQGHSDPIWGPKFWPFQENKFMTVRSMKGRLR